MASELRLPNPTRQTLQLRPESPYPHRLDGATLRLDDRLRRRPKTSTGLAPRVPLATMAEASSQLEQVAGQVNARMRSALASLLSSKEEVASKESISAAVKAVARVSGTTTTEANGIALATATRVDRFNRRDVRRSVGVDVPEFSAPIGKKWAADHVSLIKSISEESKTRFTGYLQEAAKKQTRVETIIKALKENEGVTHRRARLIARDQVLTLNAKLNEDRQRKAGITEYEWHTVSDGSVRSHHSDLHGKRFKYSQPPMGGGTSETDKGNPGSGIGCRCQAIPVIPEFEQPKRGKGFTTQIKPKQTASKPRPAAAAASVATRAALQRRLRGPAQRPTVSPAATTAPTRSAKPAAPPEPKREASVATWVKKASGEQRKAISYWSEEGYEYIRAMQRGKSVTSSGLPITEFHRAKALAAEKHLNEALATAPIHEGKIFRGMAFETEDEFRSLFTAGTKFETEAFTSFSTVAEKARNFTEDKPIGVLIELEAKNTRVHDIKSFSEISAENEALMMSGEQFKVEKVSFDEAAGLWRVVLSEWK